MGFLPRKERTRNHRSWVLLQCMARVHRVPGHKLPARAALVQVQVQPVLALQSRLEVQVELELQAWQVVQAEQAVQVVEAGLEHCSSD